MTGMRKNLTGALVLAMFAVASAASAQTFPKPAQIIVNNAPAGINIDVFLDAGKVQTVAVNQQGSTGFDLDFLSLGKPQGQVYIETCKEGVRIRVVSDGTTVPEDEGCDRKPVGVPFTFTCTHKITINFAAAKGSFAGCGTFLTSKTFLIPLGGLVGTIPFLPGDGSPAPGPGPVNQPPAVPPVANTPTPAPTAPTPAPTQPQPNTPTAPQPRSGPQIITTCTVTSDPGNHRSTLRFCEEVGELQIGASPSLGEMTVTASRYWVMVGGPIDQATGRFRFTATGPLSGTPFTAVEFQFSGTVDSEGRISGTVQIGPGGLPGNLPITFNITTVR